MHRALLICSLGLALCVSCAARAPLFMDKANHVVSSYRLARDLVDARWGSTWSEELPCAWPRVRGPVVKTATGPQSPTIGMTIAEAEQFQFEKMPIYSGCQVWVSKKWRFIFIRQPKSSSTAVMVAIKSQLCGLADPSNVNNCDPDQFAVAEDITDAMWREFFVFTIVRNPWTRSLSAHTMFTKHFLKKRLGPNGGEPGGESLVDYIGSTATIAEDWPIIVDAINKRANTSFVAGPVTNPNGHGGADGHGQETACSDANVRANFNETTLKNIARQYAMDVIRYGFL